MFDRTILFTGANGTYCGSLTAAEVVTVCERYCGACASRETAATRASQVSVARPVDKTYSKLRSAVDDTITIMSSIYTNIRTVKCPTIVIQNDNNNSEVCSAAWVGGNDAVRVARCCCAAVLLVGDDVATRSRGCSTTLLTLIKTINWF